MGISVYTVKAASQSPLSSIPAHKKQTGRDVSFDDFKILCPTSNQFNALIRESLLISEMIPSLNAWVPKLFLVATQFSDSV